MPQITLPDLASVDAFAARVAGRLGPGDVVLLSGELGAGKTALARAILRALAGDPALEVPSPSYTLVQTYETPVGDVHHFDLWRVNGPEELPGLGWAEARAGVVLVEWPERLGPELPAGLRLHIEAGEDEVRRVTASGRVELLG